MGLILNLLRKYGASPILVRPQVIIHISSKPSILVYPVLVEDDESNIIRIKMSLRRSESIDLIDPINKVVYTHFKETRYYTPAYRYVLNDEGKKYLEENFKFVSLKEEPEKEFLTDVSIENFGDVEFIKALNTLRHLKAEIKIKIEKYDYVVTLKQENDVWVIRGDTYDFRNIIKQYRGSWSYSKRAWIFDDEERARKAYNTIMTIIEGYTKQLREELDQAIKLKRQLMSWAGIEPKPEELKEELDRIIASMTKPKEEEKKEVKEEEKEEKIELTEELKEKLLPEWLCKVYVVAKRRVLQSEYKGAKGEYEVNGSELKETKVVLKDKAIAFRNFRSRFTRFLRLTSIQTPMGWIIAKPTEEVLNMFNQYMNEYAELVRKYSPESPVKPIRLVEAYIPKKVVIEMAREYVIELKASLEDVEKRLKEIEELMQKVKDEDELSKLNKENKNLLRRKKELKKLIDQAMNFIEEIEKPKKIPELISKRVEALKKVL